MGAAGCDNNRRPAWRWHLLAFGIYGVCAGTIVLHGAAPTRMILGGAAEPFAFIWFLAWWPFALAHHLNPFFTQLVWQPEGLNLVWTTSVPTLALIALPVTAVFGPVLAFNLLDIAAPIGAALGAYGLCLYLTRVPVAALVGGFLFGFSSYEMSRLSEQLNLETVVVLPCLVLLALARLDGRVGRRCAVLGGALLLAAQFGISLEVFATMVLCGGGASALAWGVLPARRARLLVLAGDGLLALPCVLLLVAPMLWAMLAAPHDVALPRGWPGFFSTDFLNFFTPTGTDVLGGGALAGVSDLFPGFLSEQSGYFGPPLLVILWLYLRRRGRFLLPLLLGICLASLGPQLWFAGRQTGVLLPWAVVRALPLLGNALPSRLMLYASLLGAIIAALWIAEAAPGRARHWRVGLGVLAALCLWPGPRPVQAIPGSAFFVPGRVQHVLGPGAKLLILPFGFASPAMFWQAAQNFGFAQAGGYLGYPPPAAQRDPVLMRFFFGQEAPGLLADFIAYCAATGTGYVVAGPGAPPALVAALEALHWPARRVDDVTILTVPPAKKNHD